MPHLQIDINRTLADRTKAALATQIISLFSEVMRCGTDHIAVSIREHGTYNLGLGRVEDPSQGIALVNADIRHGRSLEQRRELALGFMTALNTLTGVPPQHVYVTFSEHNGEDFHLYERYLADWRPEEDLSSG